jgi:hypothetical protein
MKLETIGLITGIVASVAAVYVLIAKPVSGASTGGTTSTTNSQTTPTSSNSQGTSTNGSTSNNASATNTQNVQAQLTYATNLYNTVNAVTGSGNLAGGTIATPVTPANGVVANAAGQPAILTANVPSDAVTSTPQAANVIYTYGGTVYYYYSASAAAAIAAGNVQQING